MNYQNLHLFVKVVEKGSFLAAAEAQQIPSSTVSRRIQQLEDELGYKLLHRSARKLALTEAGALFYRRCQPLYAELEAATLELEGELTAVTGNLRITAPVSLFNELLDEWFYEFLQTYPAIDMQLLLENRNIDLRDEAVDVAFRIGDAKIKDWVSRSLFHSRYILNCSQSFKHLHGSPEHPRELSEYPLIVPSRTATWLFSNAGGEVVEVTPQARFLTNELRAAAKATCAGLGISYLPHYVIKEQLQQGQLLPLMPKWQARGRDVQMLYPHRTYLPAKVRTFIEFILAKIEPRKATL